MNRHRALRRVAAAFALRSALTGGALALAAVSARAQTPDTLHRTPSDTGHATVLPRVEVQATIAPSALSRVGSDIPARLSVVNGASLGATRPRTLPEALATQPGISIYDDLGTPWKVNVMSGGFAAGPTVGTPGGISVFLDGVRQNEPDAQEVNFDLLPTGHIGHVELLNGPASLLGPNALGGAINIVSARGVGAPDLDIETTVGSFGGYSAELAGHGAMPRGWDLYAAGGAVAENGWREATSEHGYHGFLNIGREGATRSIRVHARLARSRAETAGSLPASIFSTAPRVNFTPGDFEDLTTGQVDLNATTSTSAGMLSLTTYVRRSIAERFNVNQAPDPNVRGFTRNATVGGTLDWRREDELGAGRLAWRAGLDGSVNRVRLRIFNEAQANVAPAGDDEDDEEAPGLTTDVKSPSWDAAAFGVLDYRIGHWSVTAAARADRVVIPFANQLRPADDTRQRFQNLSPRAGVSFDAGRGITLFASTGRSFRAPAILELGCADPAASCPLPFALGDDPPLAPVVAATHEAGVRLAASQVRLEASAYRTNVRDEIFFVAAPDAVLSGYFMNVPRTRRDGASVTLAGVAARDRLEWRAGYAYTDATFRSAARLFSIRSDDEFDDSALAGANVVRPGARLPLIPAHQFTGGGSYTVSSLLSLGAEARYVGTQWLRGDEANETSPLGGHAAVDAHARFALHRWTVSVAVANLFDSHRAIFGTFNENRRSGQLERFLTPMTARTLRITLGRSLRGASGSVAATDDSSDSSQ